MDLKFLKDMGQIFAWTAAGAFFAYRFYTGWFHPDLSLNLICERKPIGTPPTPMDLLTVVATVKKGPNMTIRLIDLQARVTFGGEAREKRFEGIERRCFEIREGKWSFENQKVDWNGIPSTGPLFLSLAPGDETQFATVFEVPSDKICVIGVMLFARKFIPGFSQRSSKSPNPHQWRASYISLPCCSASDKQVNSETTS